MAKRAEIIPAILVNDFASLSSDLELVSGFARTVQIDVCDGQFTPQATWPYRKHDDNFEKLVNEQEGMPGWKDLNFEVDLMANKPEDKVEDWVQAGASRIILHAEARGDVAKAIEILTGRVEIGLAFNIETDFESYVFKLRQNGFDIHFIQLMGIDDIGFQKQPFDEKVIGRIRDARMVFPGLPIAVDGGVSLENAASLIDAGADRLVVGSAIFSAESPVEALNHFKNL